MKGLPSNLAGWVVLYLFVICESVIVAWIFTGTDLPQGVANVLIAVVSGFLGLLTGRAMESLANSTTRTDSTTTVTSKEE